MNMLKFGQEFSGPAAASGNAREELPKAQTWLNIGYPVETTENGEKVTRFVSLPQGIPLDTQKAIEIKTRNQTFGAFQQAQNELLSQVQAEAAKLAPGGETLIAMGESGLYIQLRRVNDAPVTPASGAENQFVRPLFGSAAPAAAE
jgi:hypothetical protein